MYIYIYHDDSKRKIRNSSGRRARGSMSGGLGVSLEDMKKLQKMGTTGAFLCLYF